MKCLAVSAAVRGLRGGQDLRRSRGLRSNMGGGIWKPKPELPSRETGCTGAAMPCPFAPSPVPASLHVIVSVKTTHKTANKSRLQSLQESCCASEAWEARICVVQQTCAVFCSHSACPKPKSRYHMLVCLVCTTQPIAQVGATDPLGSWCEITVWYTVTWHTVHSSPATP